nr:AAA family ATPase [Lachnospiraceae bacterium]
VQSKLNNFEEYTIINAGVFAEFVGFTADEVLNLSEKYGFSYEECRNWYDGYRQKRCEIYNPESVVKSIINKEFSGYWSKTSSYQVISDRIRENYKGIRDEVVKMISGESVDVNITRYLNTMDSFHTRNDAFTYLIHVGYLAYDSENRTCRIPNKEVRQEWLNAIEDDDDYEVTNEIIEASKTLLEETLSGNEKAVAEALDVSHIHVSSNRSYNSIIKHRKVPWIR